MMHGPTNIKCNATLGRTVSSERVKNLTARGKYLNKYDTWLVYVHWSEVREILSTVLVHIWTVVILVPGMNRAASQRDPYNSLHFNQTYRLNSM